MDINYISNLSSGTNDINTNDVNYTQTKALLNTLIARLQSKTSNSTPFMLLPVRVEARFMTVSVSPYQNSSNAYIFNYANILQSIRNLGLTLATFNSFNDDSITAAVSEWDTAIKNGAAGLSAVPNANEFEINYISGLFTQVQSGFNSFKAKVQGFSFADSGKQSKALAQLSDSNKALSSLASDTNAIKVNNGKLSIDQASVQNAFNTIQGLSKSVNCINTSGRTFEQMTNDSATLISGINTSADTVTGLTALSTWERFQTKKELENLESRIVNLVYTLQSISAESSAEQVLKDNLVTSINNAKKNLALKTLPVILNTTTEGFLSDSVFLNKLTNLNGLLSEALNGQKGPALSKAAETFQLYDMLSDLNNTSRKSYISLERQALFITAISAFNELKDDIGNKISQAKVKSVSDGNGRTLNLNDILNIMSDTSARMQKLSSSSVAEADYLTSHISAITQPGADMYSVPGYQATGSTNDSSSGSAGFNPSSYNPIAENSTTQYESQLWVRIYPDDIFIETHEDNLTADEQAAGITFWQQWWAANGDSDLQLAAWRALCNSYGVARASWIVNQLTPTNLTEFQNYHVTNLLTDFQNISNFIDVLTVSDLGTLKGAEGFTATLADKFMVMKNASLNGFSVSQFQSIRLKSAMDDVSAKLNGLGSNINSTGIKELSVIHATATTNFNQLQELVNIYRNPSATPVAIFNAPIHPIFPTVQLKDNTWTEPATSGVLPDRFVVMTYNENDPNKKYRNVRVGNLIPPKRISDYPTYNANDPLYLGLDPGATDNAFNLTSTGDMIVDPKIKWMVDFDEAVQKGMGVKLILDESDKVDGVFTFDKLLVLGLKLDEESYSPGQNLKDYSKGLVEDLFESHHYEPDGMSFLTINTPTNNTGQGNSAYTSAGPTADESFAVELGAPLFQNITGNDIWQPGTNGALNVKRDGQWLSEALGIAPSTFYHVANADLRQISEAVAANRALWSGTIGMYMQDMWGPIFSQDTIKRTRKYFTESVIARGTIPSFRVSNQPYGVLAASSISRWKSSKIGQNNSAPTDVSAQGITYYAKTFFSCIQTKIQANYNQVVFTPFPYYMGTALGGDNRPDYIDDLYDLATSVLTGNDDGGVADYMYIINNYVIGNYDSFARALDDPFIGQDVDLFLQQLFEERLVIFLRTGYDCWLKLAKNKVPVVESEASTDKQADFINIVGLGATASEYYQRYGFNIGASMWMGDYYNILFSNYSNPTTTNANNDPVITPDSLAEDLTKAMWAQFNIQDTDPNSPVSFFKNFIHPGSATDPNGYKFADFIPFLEYMNQDGINESLSARYYSSRFNKLKFLTDTAQLTGPTVIDRQLSEQETLLNVPSADFISYLLNTGPLAMESGSTNWPLSPHSITTNGNSINSYNSIMYLLMKQSYLTTYRDAVMDFLVKRGFLREQERQILGTPEGDSLTTYVGLQIELGYDPALSKWDFVFDTIKNIFIKRPNTISKFVDASNFATGQQSYYNFPNNPEYAFSYSDTIISLLQNPPITPISNPSFKDALSYYLLTSNVALGDFLRQQSRYQPVVADTDTINATAGINLKGKEVQFIKTVENAFNILQSTSTAGMERLLTEHLDLCSYRLDSWISGLYNRRLAEQRQPVNGTARDGIYLGAYGVLLNVKQRSILNTVPNSAIPTNLQSNATVYTNSNNLGFILTPSVTHAMCAAILRSGYISEKYSSEHSAKLAVNLSSERVKTALFLIEGIQNGQQLGALLGYQFEKDLHEKYKDSSGVRVELDSYIYNFRRRFPLNVTVDNTPADVAQQLSLQQVVNGVDLLNTINTQFQTQLDSDPDARMYSLLTDNSNAAVVTSIFTATNADGTTSAFMPDRVTNAVAFNAICTEIDYLADMVDALGDLLTVEGIFQAVSGNFEKTSNTVQTLGEGDIAQGIPDNVVTPRTGTTVTHKFLMQIEPVAVADLNTDATNNPWPSVQLTPRAYAEPSINKWLGQILPDPANIRCRVYFNTTNFVEVSIEDIQLQPMDLLCIVANSQDGGWTELKLRMAYYVRENCTTYNSPNIGIPSNVPLDIRFMERDSSWDYTIYTLFELYPILEEAGGLINAAKPAVATDYIDPDDQVTTTNPGNVNVSELSNRANGHTVVMGSIISALQTAATQTATLTQMRDAIMPASFFGLGSAVPSSAIDTDAITMTEMSELVNSCITELTNRQAQAQAFIVNSTLSGTSVADQITSYLNALSALFANSIKVYPLFDYTNKANLATSLTTGQALLLNNDNTGGQPDSAMDGWLQGLCKVRSRIENFTMLWNLVESDSVTGLSLKPVQYPVDTTTDVNGRDFWLGIEYPEDYVPTGDKFSIVIAGSELITDALSTNTTAVGICIDEWTEIIPGKYETAGLTFNYDQPNAKAPQSILLAVSPDIVTKSTWLFEELVDTMHETIDMAKIRCVEPDHLNDSFLGQVLPAVISDACLPLIQNDGTDPRTDPLTKTGAGYIESPNAITGVNTNILSSAGYINSITTGDVCFDFKANNTPVSNNNNNNIIHGVNVATAIPGLTMQQAGIIGRPGTQLEVLTNMKEILSNTGISLSYNSTSVKGTNIGVGINLKS